jgi:PKD repeat protein
LLFAVSLALSLPPQAVYPAAIASTALTWTHLSTASNDLVDPSTSTRQAAALILDIDRNGVNDFVIASQREAGAAVVWYRRQNNGWTKYLIDSTVLDIEAGGAYHDIDGDGDLDIVFGGDLRSNQVWWWENPHPNHDPKVGWKRRLVKNSGSAKHHDQLFGDFDGDGRAELVFWNQRARKLYLAEIPANPRTTSPWPMTVIYSWSDGDNHEGLAQADIDGDGKMDIVGGGRWFKHTGGTQYTAHVIDDKQRFTRAAVGQLKTGGRPEVVFGAGDTTGLLKWYEWNGSKWVGTDLLGHTIKYGHSLQIADMNGDGHLDIFAAEMRPSGNNSKAKMWIFLGDSRGNFKKTEVATGYDNHESKVGDLDGDGDMDILGKPWNWKTPRLDIWLNNSKTRAKATSSDAATAHTYSNTESYSLTLSLADGSLANTALTVTVDTLLDPPLIVEQPIDPEVAEGEAVILTVETTGTEPLHYQWQRNGSAIPDATTATYTLPAATLADHGARFHAVVTNADGTATSQTATLSVVGAKPETEVSFAALPIPSSEGWVVQFVAVTVAAAEHHNYTWDFGDGQGGTEPTVAHQYAAPGTYDVTLTITPTGAGDQSEAASATATIIVPAQIYSLHLPVVVR